MPAPTFERALRIAGYNRRLYIGALLAVICGLILLLFPGLPLLLKAAGGLGALTAAWFAAASFLAFHWMFDRSGLLQGDWLTEEVSNAPATWLQINVGLEETTLPIEKVFPSATGKCLDLYDPAVMTEPAVTQAKQGSQGLAIAKPESLPVEDGWAELAVVTLAAHEIRNEAKRQKFFQDLRRVLASSGTLLVVEHLRDTAAALAFGPAMFHFFPRQEWLQVGKQAGLEVVRERSITPFVRVFVYKAVS